MSKNGHFSKNNSNFQKKLKSALENRVRNTHTKFHRGRTKLKTQKVRGTEAFGREERKKERKKEEEEVQVRLILANFKVSEFRCKFEF